MLNTLDSDLVMVMGKSMLSSRVMLFKLGCSILEADYRDTHSTDQLELE